MSKIVNHYLRDTGKSVLGLLTVYPNEQNFASLQPSDFFNIRNVSCIPEGEYWIKHHISPTHGKCLAITGVPERDNILMHKGNLWDHTDGCVIPGLWFGHIDKDGTIDVISSGDALEAIMKLVPEGGCPFVVQKDSKFQSVFN